MTRLQMKGAATLIFIPIFLLVIGLAMCSDKAKASEEPPAVEQEITDEQRAQALGMTLEEFQQAKADALKAMENPLTRELLVGVMIGTQRAALNEFYAERISQIISEYFGEDHEIWTRFDEMNHSVRALNIDMEGGIMDTLTEHGVERQEASRVLNKAVYDFARSTLLMRGIAETLYHEMQGSPQPDIRPVIIPEMEPSNPW